MEERRLAVPAILICSLLALPSASAAPGNANARAAVPVVVVPVPVPAPSVAPAPPLASVPAPPPLPVADAAVPAPAARPSVGSGEPRAKLAAPKSPVEAAIQQVVRLERGGRPIAIGTLLNGDGRILTALSPLTHGNQIIARYPEGQLIRVRLSHADRAWDLALLTPEGDDRRSGLKASRDPAPAAGSKVHALSYVRDKQLGASDVTIKAKITLRGGDSAELADAFELPFAVKPADIGAPLINAQGEVVAIIARACSPADKLGCTLAPYGAPVSAVRDFLRGAPPRQRSFSVGLEVVAFDAGVARGVRVAAVAPEGPAASAGLRAGPPGVGDVVLAVDGKPVATAAAFAFALDDHRPGAPARLTVLSDGRYREVQLLVAAPTDAPALAPVRNDRLFQSNPSGLWPRSQKPAAVPNPYR